MRITNLLLIIFFLLIVNISANNVSLFDVIQKVNDVTNKVNLDSVELYKIDSLLNFSSFEKVYELLELDSSLFLCVNTYFAKTRDSVEVVFFHEDDFIFGFIKYNQNNTPYWGKGFYLFDKKQKDISFLGTKFHYNPSKSINLNSICCFFRLDIDMIPRSRIIIKNGNLRILSSINYDEELNYINEKIYYIDKSEKQIYINEAKIHNIYRLLICGVGSIYLANVKYDLGTNIYAYYKNPCYHYK
ncbi:MAG: hypothetical protein HN704_14995 [Bacteroidetes bacterium]|jgi:hypothetical protein|nr:hypothetical protein [Bacteroidota bacterium]MBT6686134.1 hypothetical protein [Bacteroidota bacterium]MBT7144649.1 hypothetical protein [Bacteroidota bacterium]MBT7492904.1 hypothetical protein [Bacteroidota bacterium]